MDGWEHMLPNFGNFCIYPAIGTEWIVLGSSPGQKIWNENLVPVLSISSTMREGQVSNHISLLSTTAIFVVPGHVDDVTSQAALCASGSWWCYDPGKPDLHLKQSPSASAWEKKKKTCTSFVLHTRSEGPSPPEVTGAWTILVTPCGTELWLATSSPVAPCWSLYPGNQWIFKWDDGLDTIHLSLPCFACALQLEWRPSIALQRLSACIWPILSMSTEGHDGSEIDLAV